MRIDGEFDVSCKISVFRVQQQLMICYAPSICPDKIILVRDKIILVRDKIKIAQKKEYFVLDKIFFRGFCS